MKRRDFLKLGAVAPAIPVAAVAASTSSIPENEFLAWLRQHFDVRIGSPWAFVEARTPQDEENHDYTDPGYLERVEKTARENARMLTPYQTFTAPTMDALKEYLLSFKKIKPRLASLPLYLRFPEGVRMEEAVRYAEREGVNEDGLPEMKEYPVRYTRFRMRFAFRA